MQLANPRISPVSQIIDPTALPKAISGSPWIAAATETAHSGKVVPKLTIVAPMIPSGIPQWRERRTAEATIMSAPVPKMKSKKAIAISKAPADWVAATSLSRVSIVIFPLRPDVGREGPASAWRRPAANQAVSVSNYRARWGVAAQGLDAGSHRRPEPSRSPLCPARRK